MAYNPAAVTTIANIAALRLNVNPTQTLYVQGYYSGMDGGEGTFYLNASDTTSADNGGTIIVDAGGHRYLRSTDGLPYSVLWFGAKGDSGVTDNASAIQATIDACYRASSKVVDQSVYIPNPPTQAGGGNGYYKVGAALKLYGGSKVIGGGMYTCQLRFTADTNGFVFNDPSANTTQVMVSDLSLRGNADVSAVATVTCGLYTGPSNYCTFRNLYIQDFVDGITRDAASVGYALNHFENITVGLSKYPNPTNGYPRYCLLDTGVANKPQACYFNGILYGQITAGGGSYNGDGSTVAFDLALGAGNYLWQESGIKVYTKDANGVWSKKAIATDYTLANTDSGSVNIPAGTTNVHCSNVRVTFVGAPIAGTGNVRIAWTDPTAARCIKVTVGTGNYFNVDLGGASSLVQDAGGNNRYDVRYWQIANIGAQLGAANVVVNYNETSDSTIDLLTTRNGSAVRATLYGGQFGRQWTELKKTGGDQVISSGSYADITTDGAAYVTLVQNIDLLREINVSFDYYLTSASGAAAADIEMLVSYDNGASYSVLSYTRLECTIGGGTSIAYKGTYEKTVQDTSTAAGTYDIGGFAPNILYKAVAKLISGTSITICGSASSYYRVRARHVQPV